MVCHGQFYQGSEQEFGKNRIQYHGFSWKFYPFKRFKIYYSDANSKLALYAAKSFDHYLKEAEAKLDFSFPDEMEVIVFENQAKFRQSNIGLSQDERSQIAGTSKIFGSKIFIYYENDHQQFNYNIKAAIYEVLLRRMLLGTDWKNIVKSSLQSGIPNWLLDGLIKYLTYQWNSEIESQVKDIVLTGKINRFNNLTSNEKIYAGTAIWNYIAESYGYSSIPSIINLTRYTSNLERSLYSNISLDFQSLNRNYIRFYKARYINDYKNQKEADGEEIVIKHKKEGIYYSFKMSPDKKHIVYVENVLGKYKVKLLNLESKKVKTIYTAEHKIERIQDLSYPTIEWHPAGKALGFFTQEKDALNFHIYVLENGEKNKASLDTRIIKKIDKVLSFDYSDDGRTLIVSGVVNGQTDIFTYSVQGGKTDQITNDLYDELTPRYTHGSTKIVFTSNRDSDTIFKDIDLKLLDGTFDIYEMNVASFNRTFKYLKRITNTPLYNETEPKPTKDGHYIFTSEQNGINNFYLAKIDSVIDYIDTSIHYRDKIDIVPQSNYVTGVKEFDLSNSNELIYLIYQNQQFKLLQTKLNLDKITPIWNASYVDKRKNIKHKIESTSKKDTLYINNVNYQKVYIRIGDKTTEKVNNKDSLLAVKKLKNRNRILHYSIYDINFTKDYLVTNFDNNFLFPSYQVYQGPGSYYNNAGFNSLTKIGASDLFDDYKLMGGIRIPLSLTKESETLLSIENLKNRFDHRLLYYRQKIIDSLGGSFFYNITHDIRYRISYPFSEVLSARLTSNIRQDRKIIFPSSEFFPDEYAHTAGLNFELVFDNSIPMELNIRRGFRMKIFAEYLQKIKSIGTTINLGIDLRSYTRLTRNLIWVNRLAGATSLGSQKLLYYMGSVNNWILRPSNDFNYDIKIDPSQGYGYQTIATPLRGFIQNTRNGNSFALFTSEVRLPIFTFFSPYPVKSDFFRHLQLIAFGDVGTAWTGPHPLSPENYFNNQFINDYPIEINIQNLIEPIVGDIGFGVRSKLMGYFIKLDFAWGIENLRFQDRMTTLSLNLDI